MSIYQLEDTVTPSETDMTRAKHTLQALAKHVDTVIRLESESGEVIPLPDIAVRMLMDILSQLAKGNAITLIPIHAELTTQQAANVLGVSRPFLVKELENEHIPFRKVGRHRRVLFKDLITYKQSMLQGRHQTLDTLSAQAQELDMGY